jgi:hypothetical protein
MKLLTLIISARAFGVETLLELAILEQLTRPEHRDPLTGKSTLTLAMLEVRMGDTLTAVAESAARLEAIGLTKSRRLFAGAGPRSLLIDLTDKGKKLMFGNTLLRSKKLTPTLR